MGYIIDLGAIIGNDTLSGFGRHVDFGVIIKVHCVLTDNRKVESGKVVTREDVPSPKDFLKANGF